MTDRGRDDLEQGWSLRSIYSRLNRNHYYLIASIVLVISIHAAWYEYLMPYISLGMIAPLSLALGIMIYMGSRQGNRASGFLPMKTNGFDRIFISVVLYIAIHLVWMRFLEPLAPLEIATGLSAALAVLIYLKG